MFVDEAEIEVQAGHGGAGAVAFRREKYVPRGGPAGGDGGRGGDVVLVCTTNAHTLSDFRMMRRIRAESGQPGGSKQKTGRDGEDAVVRVPEGTLVTDVETGERVADMTEEGQRVVVARGGDGGQGNMRFKTSTNRAPRRATPGYPGGARRLRLELKLVADVGLVGFPSVGKSTLIAAISNAQPKIAAYPFTTLVPNLGVVRWKGEREFVVADIPGLIEGAHEGQGLGHQFLRHVERCRLLVHVLEVTPQVEGAPGDGREPVRDFEAIRRELERYEPQLLERPQMVALNKVDLPFVAAEEARLRAHIEEDLGLPFFAVSAATGEGLEALVDRMGEAAVLEIVGEERQLEFWEEGGSGIPPRTEDPPSPAEEA